MLPQLEKRITQLLITLTGLACIANAQVPNHPFLPRDVSDRNAATAEFADGESAKSVVKQWVRDLSNNDKLALEKITSFPFTYMPVSRELKCKRVVARPNDLTALVQCIASRERLLTNTLTYPLRPDLNTTRIVSREEVPSNLRVLIGPLKKTEQLVYCEFLGDGVNYDLVFIVDLDRTNHRLVRKVLIDSEYDSG